MECELIDSKIRQDLQSSVNTFIKKRTGMINDDVLDHITLLNMSRNVNIMELMIKAINSSKTKYRTKIILRKESNISSEINI